MHNVRSEDAHKFYTDVVDEKMGADYEASRWHANPRDHELFRMTDESIDAQLIRKATFASCCELGPGAATWTRKLIAAQPCATYDLVDISAVMLDKAKKVVDPLTKTARYIVAEFNSFQPDRKYDLFFSIRAFEYVSDKESAADKITDLLASGGRGYIITKTPHYTRALLSGHKYSPLHRGQITPRELRVLFARAGMSEVTLYPVTFTVPKIQSVWLHRLLFKLFGNRPLNPISQFFSESYAVTFKKL